MAILTDIDRDDVHAKIMRDQSGKRKTLSLTKADLRAAVNAADQWLEDNKVSYNQAIPQPARDALTAKQKALLLQFVALKRFGVEI